MPGPEIEKTAPQPQPQPQAELAIALPEWNLLPPAEFLDRHAGRR
jgi:hypothetical protein